MHRQRLPESPSRISSIVGSGFLCSTDARPPESCPACRCRTARRRIPRKPPARRASRSPDAIPSIVTMLVPIRLQNRHQAAVHQCAIHQAPSMNRTHLRRNLLSRPSIPVPVATRRASVPSDKRTHFFGSPLTVNEISALAWSCARIRHRPPTVEIALDSPAATPRGHP